MCATWNGLDDNFMPVPPGNYGAVGITSPARLWAVDGKFHAITPKYVGAALPFAPSPQNDSVGFHTLGDPVWQSMSAVAVDSVSKTAVFYHYCE